jgi:hypothetical protein
MMAAFDGIVSLYLSILRRLLDRGPALSAGSVCLCNRRIVSSEFDNEVVLFDTGSRSTYLINHTAAAVIRLTDGSRSLAGVALEISREFGEERGIVAADVKRIYREFIREGVCIMVPDRSFKPRIKRDAVIRQEDDGAFIFDPITDELFAVNETGLLVLEQIDGKRALSGIIDAVAAHFSDVDEQAVGRDVETFVQELLNRGLIVA